MRGVATRLVTLEGDRLADGDLLTCLGDASRHASLDARRRARAKAANSTA